MSWDHTVILKAILKVVETPNCKMYVIFFWKNFEALLVQHLFKVILPSYFVQNFNLNHIALSEGNLLLGIRILLELMVAPLIIGVPPPKGKGITHYRSFQNSVGLSCKIYTLFIGMILIDQKSIQATHSPGVLAATGCYLFTSIYWGVVLLFGIDCVEL